MSVSQIFFSILAAFVGIASLIMALARTPPEDAASNLSKWAARLKIYYDRRIDEIAYRWAKAVLIVVVTVGLIGAVYLRLMSKSEILGSPAILPLPVLPTIPKTDTAYQGVLKPANHPTPPNGCDHLPLPLTATKIIIGDNATALTGNGRMTVLQIRECEALAVERTPDGVFLSAEVNDGSGIPPAKIVNNQIVAYNGEYYSSKQSADLSSIIVKNANNKILLAADFLNPNTIKIKGLFGCTGKRPVVVEDDHPIPGILMTGSCFANPHIAFSVD